MAITTSFLPLTPPLPAGAKPSVGSVDIMVPGQSPNPAVKDQFCRNTAADQANLQMEQLRRQAAGGARQEPRLNLVQRGLIGTGQFLGRGIRKSSNLVGVGVRRSIENPARLLPGANLAISAGDAIGLEGPKVNLPGTKFVGSGAESVVRGFGEFAGSMSEEVTAAVAHPIQTAEGVNALAQGLQTDTPQGVASILVESATSGKSYLDVRAERRKVVGDAVGAVATDFTENREEIGLPGAVTKTALDIVGLPKTAVLSGPRLSRLATAGGRVARDFSQGQSKRLSRTPELEQLPLEQQALVETVAKDNAPRIAGVKIPFYTGKSERSLSQLLSEGRLQKDSSLLSEIQKLNEADVAPAFSKPKVVSETLESVARPGTISQGCKGTCAATTPQFDLAETQPATFVKTARRLMSESGDVSLPDGKTLSRNPTGVRADGSGRRQLDRVMQSSLMEFAGQDSLKASRYSNKLDSHLNPDGTPSHGGLSALESERVRRSVMGEDVVSKTFPRARRGNRRVAAETEFEADLARAQAESKNMQVTLAWGAGPDSHAVSVSRIEGDYIYGRNPWGSKDIGQGGLKREMLDSEGRFRAKTSDFFDELHGYHPLREPGVPYKRNPNLELFR